MNNTAINFKTIAVDFDGTLCYSDWPNCGQPNHLRLLYRWSDVSSGMYEGLEPMMSAMPFLLICYFPMSRPLRTNSNNLVFPNKRFYHSLDSSFGYTKSVRQFLLSYFWIVLHNFTYLILCIFRFSDILMPLASSLATLAPSLSLINWAYLLYTRHIQIDCTQQALKNSFVGLASIIFSAMYLYIEPNIKLKTVKWISYNKEFPKWYLKSYYFSGYSWSL